jgi:Fur family ferric uptake transcriptional regulator
MTGFSEDQTARELLEMHMVRHGLRASRQRDVIVDVFLEATGHVAIDELHERVRRRDTRIGQATVYRTMKLLVDCGVAVARHFGDGHTRYELADLRGTHHDHLICTECGAIVEFVDDRIADLQSEVAERHRFEVTRHRLELYGRCPSCRIRSQGPVSRER